CPERKGPEAAGPRGKRAIGPPRMAFTAGAASRTRKTPPVVSKRNGGPERPPPRVALGYAVARRRRPNKPSPKRAPHRSAREAGSGTPFGKSSPLDIGALAEAVVVAN